VVMRGDSVPLLLGQSALKQLGAWSINASKSRLEFNSNVSQEIEVKPEDESIKSKTSLPTSRLLCTGEIIKTTDVTRKEATIINLDVEIDYEHEIAQIDDYWGCLAFLGAPTSSKEKGCWGRLPLDITESKISYSKSNKGDLYDGMGLFEINRSSGIMTIAGMASSKNPKATWFLIQTNGKLQCKKIERQF